MTDTAPQNASDLIEHNIRVQAPLYGMAASVGLLHRLDKELIGKKRRLLRFPPSHEAKVVDTETGARWEPLPLGPWSKDDHWYFGQVTMDEALVSEYYYGYLFRSEAEDLIPDMFAWDELVVSERVRDLIAEFAPGFCYFAPVTFVGMDSGKPAKMPLFKVLVRRCLYFDGPLQRPRIRPQGQNRTLVDADTWTAFCQRPDIQKTALELPIFLFNRMEKYPILNADLFQHLKAHDISGLLETTLDIPTDPKRPEAYLAYESIYPLDPDYRTPIH
ncbi:MAG: hypothetical protein AB3N23_21475 [Paracoccaceae bacterium]